MTKSEMIERLLRETRFLWPYPSLFEVALAAKDVVESQPRASFDQHREMLEERVARWSAERPAELRFRGYEREIEGLTVALHVCLDHLARAASDGGVTKRLCELAGRIDVAKGRPLMHVYDDSKLARLAQSEGMQKAENTIRQKLAEVRRGVEKLGTELGCPCPALCGGKIPSRPGRANGCPVRSAVEDIWEVPPLVLCLYPELLLLRLENFVRTLIWAFVRPFDAQGRRNEQFQSKIVEVLVEFEQRANSSCAAQLQGSAVCASKVAEQLRLMFQEMMKHVLVEWPDEDARETRIVEAVQELCQLLGIDPRDLRANR